MRHEKAEALIGMARRLAASAEGMTLDEIAAAMNVGRRTADRVRAALAALFPQMEEVSDGPSKRFRIPRGLDSFLQDPTTGELLGLSKAADHFRGRGLAADAKALDSLGAKVRSAMRSAQLRKVSPDLDALLHAELIAVQAGPRPVEDNETLLTIRNALLSMKGLRFVYSGGSRPGAFRKVAPYGIIFGRMNYLVAAELGSTKPKHWRLDRISKISILAESAQPPSDFSLSAFAGSAFGFFQDEPDDVVLRVLPDGISDDFANWRFHPTQTVAMQADGSAIVQFRASGMLELAWHLFSWGGAIEILAPTALREIMLTELRKSLAQHKSKPKLQK